jgi:hypothetical protein
MRLCVPRLRVYTPDAETRGRQTPGSNGAHSSVGQSYRLITGWSLVRVQVGPLKKAQEAQKAQETLKFNLWQ